MHFAKVETSERLQKVFTLLKDYKPRTTREIIREADVCAVNSIIAEIRMNGYQIRCTPISRGVFEYQLLPF